MKIICINGFPESGKDLFCSYCQPFCYSYSTVDFVKEIAYKCGWDGSKTLENRKFLSDLKDLLTNWNDVPLKDIKKKIQIRNCLYENDNDFEPIFFIHVREPEELKRLKEEWNVKTLLIRRPSVEFNEHSNHADSEVLNFNYDYIIDNIGTQEDLKKIANNFIIKVRKENWRSKLED